MSTVDLAPFTLDLFAPSRMADEFGHVCSYEETFARVSPLLRTIPITRVFDATPLDTIGVPVWSAVTPLARDLTVHAGKGRTHASARLSAIMEAIERVSAESLPKERVLRASFAELQAAGVDAIDPESLDLPYETSYAPERQIAWVEGYDLLTSAAALVPLDFVLLFPSDGVSVGVETNGLASGNTFTEAVVHALYELIERDAVSQEEFLRRHAGTAAAARRPVRVVDLRTLPDPAREIADVLEKAMLRVYVQHLAHVTGVHVFAAILADDHFPGSEEEVTFAGYGADLDPRGAVMRALLEAVQGHTIVTVGSRDVFEGTRPIPDRAATLMRRVDLFHPADVVPCPDDSGEASIDVAENLRELLSRLSAANFERCLVVDVTNRALGIPVIRTLVPGLAGPYGATSRRPGLRLLRTIL